MSYANILLLDPEVRDLLKKAKDLSQDSPCKKQFAALVLEKNLRQLELHEPLEQTGLEKEENILTGRLIEELKQQTPEIFEEQLRKQAETETSQLQSDMNILAVKSTDIMRDFKDKFIARCRTDFQKGFDKLTCDENIDHMLNQELATLPDDVSKAILENIFEVKKTDEQHKPE